MCVCERERERERDRERERTKKMRNLCARILCVCEREREKAMCAYIMCVRLQLHLILITRKCFYPFSYPSYPFLMFGITTCVRERENKKKMQN